MFRMGSSEYASWQGFRCNPNALEEATVPCEGIKVSSANMKTDFEGKSYTPAYSVADTLFSNAEMTGSAFRSDPITKFSKLIVDDEFTSDTT